MSKRAIGILASTGFSSILALGCGEGPSSAPPPATPAAVAPPPEAAGTPCNRASAERARVASLRAAGKLDRALRVLDGADRLCSESAAAGLGARVALLAEIGRCEEARAAADAIDAAPTISADAKKAAGEARARCVAMERPLAPDGEAKARALVREGDASVLAAQAKKDTKRLAEAKATYLGAWEAFHPHGDALYAAGLAARALGDAAEAQRLFDRAIVDFERATRSTLALSNFALAGAMASPIWTPDGRFFAIAHGPRIELADTQSPRQWRTLLVDLGGVREALFAPNGRALASSAMDPGRPVVLWDPATGEQVRSLAVGEEQMAERLLFSPAGDRLAVALSSGEVRLWDAGSGRQVIAASDSFWDGEQARVLAIAFSPGGDKFAVVFKNKGLRVWDTKGAGAKMLLEYRDQASSLVFSPDGKSAGMCLLNPSSPVATWNVEMADLGTGRRKTLAKDGCASTTRLFFSADGATLFSESGPLDVKTGKVRLDASPPSEAEPETPEVPEGSGLGRVFRAAASVSATTAQVVFSPDGSMLATVTEGPKAALRLRDAATGKPVETCSRSHSSEAVTALAFSPDGATLAVAAGKRVVLCARGNAIPRATFVAKEEVTSLAFSPDGALFLVASLRSIELASTTKGAVVRALDLKGERVERPAFTAGGSAVAGMAGRTVVLWDVATGGVQKKLPGLSEGGIQFSPDGALLAALTPNNTVEIRSVESGGTVHQLPHAKPPIAVTFTDGGRRLATLAEHERTLWIWDTATGKEVRWAKGIRTGNLTPNGRFAAVTAYNDAILLQPLDAPEVLLLMRNTSLSGSYTCTQGSNGLCAEVEFFEGVGRSLVACQVGVLRMPFELCAERFERPGLWAGWMAGTLPEKP